MGRTILVADDEENITDVCRRYLEREGYQTLIAHDGEQAVRLWKEQHPDLVVLDLMMPGKTGWQVCDEIRNSQDVPILMLTARGEEPDRLLGLTMGADDYMTKPFSPRELVLRVNNILRRTAMAASGLSASDSDETILHASGITVYTDQHRVHMNGKDVELTAKEFEMLYLFMSHPNQVFSRTQLLSRIWGYDFGGDTTTVTVHIRRLREKIEPSPSEPFFIKTVWGIGYKFEEKQDYEA